MEQTKRNYKIHLKEIGERKKKDNTDKCEDLLTKKAEFEANIEEIEVEVENLKIKLN